MLRLIPKSLGNSTGLVIKNGSKSKIKVWRIGMDKVNQDFIFCNRKVIEDKRLTFLQTKVLLALFSFRNKDTNLCFPSREAISKRINIRTTSISKITTELVALNWLEKAWNTEIGKFLYTITVPDLGMVHDSSAVHDSSTKGVHDSSTKGVHDSSTHNYKDNYEDNLINKKDEIYESVINDLNEKTGKNYKPTSSNTRKFIDARVKDGFALEDFVKVNGIKARDWNDDPANNKYLRPETLYGNKFEGYLQEKEVTAVTVQPQTRFPSKDERAREGSSHLKLSIQESRYEREHRSNQDSTFGLFRELPDRSN